MCSTRVVLATDERLADVPIYTYECTKCGEEHDEFVFKHSDKKVRVECPLCGGPSLATATVAHVAGRHTNKDSVKVPGEHLSISVDGFKRVPAPPAVRKQVTKNGRQLHRKREPKKLKTVREL